MNQQLIQTTKATILVVGLPEGVTMAEVDKEDNLLMCWPDHSDMADYVDLPPGEWELLGKTFELSEEQWKEVVADHEDNGVIDMFKNYVNIQHWLTNAAESGVSLLTANQVYRENPMEPVWEQTDANGRPYEKHFDYHSYVARFEQAEQHVFRNAYTLIKK